MILLEMTLLERAPFQKFDMSLESKHTVENMG